MRQIPSLAIGLVIGAIAAASGCGSSTDSGGTGGSAGQVSAHQAKSSLPRDTSPSVPAADAKALSDGNATFAFDLYGSADLKPANGNFVCSPLSASLALAMTWAGARGATEQDMAKALHFTLPQASLHPAMNALALELDQRNQAADPANGTGFQLALVNALWGEKTEHFVPAFLDTLAQNYGAGVNLVDFMHAADAARQEINDWVSQNTAGKIQDLLAPGDVSDGTRMVLTNAVYFKASWKDPFMESLTSNDTFHAPSADVTVPMMHAGRTLRYAEGAGWQAVELPYDGEQVGMTIVLPAAGQLAAVESGLDLAWLEQLDGAESEAPVDLTMPKYDFTFRASLRPALEALGMKTAFGNADFSGMMQDAPAIGDVLQKAFIAVDEKGTEAAAATGVVLNVDGSAPGTPPPPKVFRMDRPFVFFIRDYPTGAILFAGRVLDPSQS